MPGPDRAGQLAAQDARQRPGEGARVFGRDKDAAALAQGAHQAVDRGADDRHPESQGQHGACDYGSAWEGTTCTLAPAI
jgi:hypothetical protein